MRSGEYRVRFRKTAGILILGVCLALPWKSRAATSPKSPDIAYVYPAGGQKGSAVEITIGGQLLGGVTGVLISGEGIHASITGYTKPLPAKRFAEFRDSIAESKKQAKDPMQAGNGGKGPRLDIASILQEDGATPEEIEMFRIMQKQRADPKRQDNSQLVENVTLHLEISPEAEKGPRTLRLFGKKGLSNPLSFLVGDYPEERQPGATEPRLPSPPKIQFPVVLNGQILPGQSDTYLFSAAKGEQILFVAQARDLIPYLADAVPGWFQPVLTVFDSQGTEVASAGSGRFAPDPTLVFEAKRSGEYKLEIRDALHRGREDFIYRVSAGHIPFVTGIFPLGGRPGSDTTLEVSGWNLSRRQFSFHVPPAPGIHSVPELANGFATADVSFESDPAPEIVPVEPDNDPAHATRVAIPSTINGRMDFPGDMDVFSVQCKKGEPLVAEVFARRLNSPMDSYLQITDTSGKQLAYSDDHEDMESGLLTQHADSKIEFHPPGDGRYYIRVGDSQRQSGPEFSYCLRLANRNPDFALRIVPSAINGAPGTPSPVTVYAIRKDGFSGDINLSATPGEFTLSGGCIPAGSDSITATLTFPETMKTNPEPVEITGTAEISGTRVSRKATPADDMLQAFIYHHLVPADSLLAYSPPEFPPKKPAITVLPGTVVIPPENAGRTKVLLPKFLTTVDVRAELQNPPEGIRIESVTPNKDGIEIAFCADPKKIKPGSRGNLIVELNATQTQTKGDKPPVRKHWTVGLLPAIPYELAKK